MRERSILSVAMLAAFLVFGCTKQVDDAALVTNIKSQMFSDQQLKDSTLQVTSSQGQVMLSGTVPSDAARLDAYKIATVTPGVTKVIDQMTVEVAQAPQPAPAQPPAPKKPQPPPHRTHVIKHSVDTETADSVYSAPPVVPVPPPQPAPAPEQPAEPVPAPAPPPPPPPPPPPQPKTAQVASNTTLTIRMIDGIDSQVNHAGEVFHASLEAPIVVDNEVIVPKGADVYVRLSSASSAGKFTGKSELHLELVKLEFQGQSYPLVSSTYSLAGDSRGKNTTEKVGGGAVLGAIIGALAGGGKGAAVGAAGGGVYQGATSGKQVKIPSETKLDFQLDQPVTITLMPPQGPATQ